MYTLFWQKVPKSIRSIEKSYLYKCNRQACFIFTRYQVHFLIRMSATFTDIFLNPSHLHQRPCSSSVLWLGYSVGLISDRMKFLFQNLTQSTLPPILLHNAYRRSFPTGYRGMTLNIYFHEVRILKKVWRFPTTRKLPLEEEVFIIKMSRSSARMATL